MKESTHRGEQDGHSPEPWSEVNYTDLDALKECNAPFGLLAGDGKALFMTMADGNPLLLDDDSARIIACVNACAGIAPEVLDRIIDGGGFGAIFCRMLGDKKLYEHLKGIGFKMQFTNEKSEEFSND